MGLSDDQHLIIGVPHKVLDHVMADEAATTGDETLLLLRGRGDCHNEEAIREACHISKYPREEACF